MPARQLQYVPYRLPVHARAFHRHVSNFALLQPLCQLLQILGEGPEFRGLQRLFAAADAAPHTHRHRILVYVQSRATTMYDTHVASSLPRAKDAGTNLDFPSRALRLAAEATICCAQRTPVPNGCAASVRTTFTRGFEGTRLGPVSCRA